MTDQTPKITQAMIDAYDEYTHLTLDRRGFMNKLTGLAGSATAAAAIAPLLSANQARAAIVAADDPRVTSGMIVFPGASGPIKAYLAIAADAAPKAGGVIVIHENRGLNAHVMDVTRRMALEGFVAMAPDFLSPSGGTPDNEDTAREMISALDRAVTVSNAVAARTFLAGHERVNGKVGAVGFCWGGGMVNALAVNDPALAAGVAYYGSQAKAEDVPKIKAPLLLHYAGLDDRINKGIAEFEAALKAAGTTHTIHLYDGVNHAFNNDTSAARYDKAAADLAWGRTVAFLKETLG